MWIQDSSTPTIRHVNVEWMSRTLPAEAYSADKAPVLIIKALQYDVDIVLEGLRPEYTVDAR
jgi:hypothetical protein